MNEAELKLQLDLMSKEATGNNTKFIAENAELLDRYMGNPYGNEMPERSKVISQDVMDVVEADMPSLSRIFLGATDILKFKPNSQNEEDVKEADDKTKYVDWQIRKQPWSFEVLSGFIKNAEIQKTSVVKYMMEETTQVEEHRKTGLSNEELAVFQESLEGEDVESVEIDREEKNGDEVTVILKVKKTRKRLVVKDVKLENVRLTKNAESKYTAPLVGDVSITTRGELLALGYDRNLISSITEYTTEQLSSETRLPTIRNEDEGGTENTSVTESWASEEVEIEDLYALIDFDEDGIQERRRIIRAGDVILENEVFNHVPYAFMSSILMPHKVVGRSRAEVTAPTAEAKTAILRGVQDNIYAVNAPRLVVDDDVMEMDDVLAPARPQGTIRGSNNGAPIGNSIFPIVTPYIGDKALQVIQYWDHARSQSTGSLLPNQGLDADKLGQETATRFEGIESASQGKVELVARVMAETGFRQLYEGVAWLDANFQNTGVEFEVLGEQLTVKPSDWKHEHNVVSRVGLGAGDDEAQLRTLSSLWLLHQQLQTSNSPMTDEVKRFNVLKGMVNASGIPEVDEYFNNPEQPEELIKAQNEILTKMVEQLQLQLEQLQNPLAEAETIKAQAGLIKAQGQAQIDIEKLAENQRQFNVETAQKQDQFMKDLAFKITELEKKFNTEVTNDS